MSFSCSSCGTVVHNGTRVSVGDKEGSPAIEIVRGDGPSRVVLVSELADKFKATIPQAIKTEKPHGG